MCRKLACILTALLVFAGLSMAAGYETPPKAGDPFMELGTFIALDDGQKLQLFVEDKQIVAYFIDKEGLIMESPADSILFTIDDPGHKDDEFRTVLKRDGDIKLTSPRRLFGPYSFRARIIIRFTDGKPSSFPNVLLNLRENL